MEYGDTEKDAEGRPSLYHIKILYYFINVSATI